MNPSVFLIFALRTPSEYISSYFRFDNHSRYVGCCVSKLDHHTCLNRECSNRSHSLEVRSLGKCPPSVRSVRNEADS